MTTKRIILNFVILLFFGVITAQNQNDNQAFLNAQFLILEQVKPLTPTERQQMESFFHAEFAVSGSQEIAFNMAMSKTLTNLDFYEHYYKETIAKRAQILYNDDLIYHGQKRGLNQTSLDDIMPYLLERSKEIALYELRYFAFPTERSTAIKQIRQKYSNGINDVYIRNEARGASFNLGLVLQNRERLNLTDSQVDSIVAATHKI